MYVVFILIDIGDIYRTSLRIFSDIVNAFAPTKEKRVKRSFHTDCFTSEIKKVIVDAKNY